MGITFEKYEALRNDFVLVEAPGGAPPPVALCQAMCARRSGVGADGVLSILPPRTPGAVAMMHITNADGSMPEMCGNGIRCVAAWLRDRALVEEGVVFVLDTPAGPREVSIEGDAIDVDMGTARMAGACAGTWQSAPLAADDPVRKALREAHAQGADVALAPMTAVSVGNPHLIVPVPLQAPAAEALGPILEHHARFAHRTNVEFTDVRGRTEVHVVVWERGVGLTDACGSGACAVAAALAAEDRVDVGVPVAVHLPGGPLAITVTPAGDAWHVRMQGPARRVYTGTWMQ